MSGVWKKKFPQISFEIEDKSIFKIVIKYLKTNAWNNKLNI
jgi:hypothetical protein